jgi:hypothetical protein
VRQTSPDLGQDSIGAVSGYSTRAGAGSLRALAPSRARSARWTGSAAPVHSAFTCLLQLHEPSSDLARYGRWSSRSQQIRLDRLLFLATGRLDCQEAAAARPTDFDASSPAGLVGLADERYHRNTSVEPPGGPARFSRAPESLRSVRTGCA